jgi:hypothetical protein
MAKTARWDKLMRLQRRIGKLERYHQDAAIELIAIKAAVTGLIIDEREGMRGEKQDANTNTE